MMTEYATKITQLGKRVLDLGSTLAEARGKRIALAPKVVDGDRAAIKQLDQIDATAATLQREIELVNLAVDQLKAEADAEAAETEAKYRAQRERDARSAMDADLRARPGAGHLARAIARAV